MFSQLSDDFAATEEGDRIAGDEQELVVCLKASGRDRRWADDEVVRGYFRARRDIERSGPSIETRFSTADKMTSGPSAATIY